MEHRQDQETSQTANAAPAAWEAIWAAAEHDHRQMKTGFRGNKSKLLDWIGAQIPKQANSVFDGFSGSGAVSYYFKTKGLGVIANDRMAFPYHTAKALVENSRVTLSDTDIEGLHKPGNTGKGFVETHFSGLFFAKGVHGLIEEHHHILP